VCLVAVEQYVSQPSMDLFGRHRPARRRRGDEGQERPRRAAPPLAGLR